LTGPEQSNASLHFHNDEQRSPVHLGKAFGHFSCSHPGLRIAKLIEDMQLTGAHFIAQQTHHSLLKCGICSLYTCSVGSVSSSILQPVDVLSCLSLFVNFAACGPAQLAQSLHQFCFKEPGDNAHVCASFTARQAAR